MALSDLINEQPINPLQGLPEGVKAGFELAQAKQQIQQRQKELELREQELQVESGQKMLALLPKLQGAKGAFKEAGINLLAKLAKMSGVPLEQSALDSLSSDADTLSSYSNAVNSIKEAYLVPGKEDYIGAQGALAELNQKMGMDSVFGKEVSNTINEQMKEKIRAAAVKQKAQERVEKLLQKVAPEPEFMQGYNQILDPEDKSIALFNYQNTRNALDSINKDLMSASAQTELTRSDEEFKKIQEIYALVKQKSNNVEKVLSGEVAADVQSLQAVVNNAIRSGYIKKQEATETREGRALAKQRLETSRSEVEYLQKVHKDFKEQLNLSKRALNILNDPKLANSPIGANAVVTLFARYLDPRTGVREAEQNRVFQSLYGGERITDGMRDRFRMMIEGMVAAPKLSQQQQEFLKRIVIADTQNVESKLDELRGYSEERLAGSGLNVDSILGEAFDRDAIEAVKKAKEGILKGTFALPDAIPDDIKQEYQKAKAGEKTTGWFSGIRSFFSGEKKQEQKKAEQQEEQVTTPSISNVAQKLLSPKVKGPTPSGKEMPRPELLERVKKDFPGSWKERLDKAGFSIEGL